MIRKSIDNQLDIAEVAIEGVLGHPDIQKLLANYGYDRKRVMEGKALLNTARMLQSGKNQKQGAQREASSTLQRDRQLAWKAYMRHVTLARLSFPEDSGAWKKLQLSGGRKRSFAGWLEQARNFYHELSNDTVILEQTGIAREEVEQAQAMVDAVRAARQQHKYCRGEAQQATQNRNKALQELRVWTKRFLKIAAIALEGQEQMLEALGMVVKA